MQALVSALHRHRNTKKNTNPNETNRALLSPLLSLPPSQEGKRCAAHLVGDDRDHRGPARHPTTWRPPHTLERQRRQHKRGTTAPRDLTCPASSRKYPCPFRLIRGKSRIELLQFIEWRGGKVPLAGTEQAPTSRCPPAARRFLPPRQPVCLPSLCSTSNPSAQVVMAEAAEYDEELHNTTKQKRK